jgi:hypothetical protein
MWLLLASMVAVAFGLGALLGAPYLPILRSNAEPIFELAELTPGQTLIDLGSGDGRLLRAAAQRGIRAIGYEINPLLYVISWLVCWRYRQLVTIHLADFWRAKLPPADVIYVFLIERYMARLDRKLTRELVRPTIVVSHVFELPGRTATSRTATSWRYNYRPLEPQPDSV